MSTAHRPTWDPAQAREVKGGSRQYSVRDMAAHTKLKFRCVVNVSFPPPSLFFTQRAYLWQSEFLRQPGQTSVSEVKKVNLRAELLAAEADARAKKRKAAGLPVEDVSSAVPVAAIEDAEVKKRRKVLQDALEMDKDADSDEDDDADADADGPKGGESKYVAHSRFSFSSPMALIVPGYTPIIEQWGPYHER
jgi:protein CWC15